MSAAPVVVTSLAERRKASQKKWRAKNPDYFKIHYLKNKERYRANARRLSYGLTPEAFEVLLQVQAGCCAICKSTLCPERTDVDHDHVSGRVRGLLCHRCNTGIGLLGDSTDRLAAAVDYLRKQP